MQGLTLAANMAAKKQTLMLGSTENYVTKSLEHEM